MYVSPTASSGHLAVDSNDEISESFNAANKIQDFCDAPPGEVSQEGQFKLSKVYVNKSNTAQKNKKWLDYDPTQLRLTEYLHIMDAQVKEAVIVLKGLQPPIKQSGKGHFSTAFFSAITTKCL